MSNNKQYGSVKPQDIMDATALDEFDTVSMMIGVMRSDFTLALLIEWSELEMPDISYRGFIETNLENHADFMRSDLNEMMDVDMHLGFIQLLKELAILDRIDEEAS